MPRSFVGKTGREAARERRRVQENLKMLRDAGVLLKFETLKDAGGAEYTEKGEMPIQAARQGTDFYIAPDDERTKLFPYYNAACKRAGGLAIKVASWEDPAYITLDNTTTFHFYRTMQEYGKRKSNKFEAEYVKKLNSRC